MVAAAYEALDARVRAAYRRATAAALRLRVPERRADARRELTARRAELAAYGALRYVAALDAALQRRVVARRARTAMLPRRELQAALLISRGFTDAGIADELRVPVAQASDLVRSVLKRLGVTTRSQVAGWVVSRDAGRVAGRTR
jgi:DNA-binding NarL/FixJ family response regulator